MKNIIYILFILVLCSCKTKYVEVPITTIKTEYIDKYTHDSIYTKDSIYIKDKGDTLILYIYNTLYKYKYIKDTINVRDTLTNTVKVIEEVEVNKLTWWLLFLVFIGEISLISLFIIILIKMK